MSRRIDIELTSTRDDGSWTWRAAGAREPKGTVDATLLPAGVLVGDVLRVEVEGHLDGIEVTAVVPARNPRREPERLELLAPSRAEDTLVTTRLAGRRGGRGRDRDRGERGRGDRPRGRDGGDRRDRDRDRDRRERRDRRGERGERPERQAPPVEAKPKPKRLRPRRAHRDALLEAVAAEQKPILEQLLAGGIPAVRSAIDKQNEALKAEGKPEVGKDALLKVAEDLRSRAAAAVWRDRAEAAVANVDDLDLRDLRSVVNAAGDAGRDEQARALAAQLREALANRVEKEQSAWLAELADTLRAGRTVRALRLSSRPPKAGAIIPAELSNQLVEQANAALSAEASQDRWATVLDALAYSPIRRRVIPASLPEKLSPQMRETVARLGSRLPEIAHIFDIEPDESAGRPARPARRRAGGKQGEGRGRGDGKGGDRSGKGGDRSGKGRRGGEARQGRSDTGKAPSDQKPAKQDRGGDAGKGSAPAAEGTPAQAAPAAAEGTPAEGPITEAAPAGAVSAEAPGTPTEATATGDAAAQPAPAEAGVPGTAGEAPDTTAGAEADATTGEATPEPANGNGSSPVIEVGTPEGRTGEGEVAKAAETATDRPAGPAGAEAATGGDAAAGDAGDAAEKPASPGDEEPATP